MNLDGLLSRACQVCHDLVVCERPFLLTCKCLLAATVRSALAAAHIRLHRIARTILLHLHLLNSLNRNTRLLP